MGRAPHRQASNRRKHNGGRRALFVIVSLLVAGFAAPRAPAVEGGQATPTPLVGRVIDERRFPVAGASVTLRTPRSTDVAIATTDADGRFELPFQRPPPSDVPDRDLGTLLVTTADRRVGCSRVHFREGQHAQRPIIELHEWIVVAPCGRLRAKVRDTSGPVADAIVELRDEAGGTGFTSTRTDADGIALVDPAPVGEFALFAKKSGRGRATIETKIETGGSAETTLDLRELRSLSVEVADADDGSPVVGASFTVFRDGQGPNPGAFPRRFRCEDFVAEPAVTDEHGRLELRELEEGTQVEIRVLAPHHVMNWGSGIPISGRQVHPLHVSADDGAVRVELPRRSTRSLRYLVEPGSIAAPPDGTTFTIEQAPRNADWSVGVANFSSATYHEGVLDFTAEFPPRAGRPAPLTGWATGPGSVAVQLLSDHDRGVARLVRCVPLEVTVVAADGSPRADREVLAMVEPTPTNEAPPQRTRWTDAQGTARFESLRVGRWVVSVDGVVKIVDLQEEGRVVLKQDLSTVAEIVLQFTVDGERRLPTNPAISIDSERRDLHREDPAKGDVHVFVDLAAGPRQFIRVYGSGSVTNLPLPELPVGAPTVLAIPISTQRAQFVIGHVRGFVRGRGDWQPRVSLERLDEATGEFVADEARMEVPIHGAKGEDEVRFGGVSPGTYRLALHESNNHGMPARVGEDGATEPLELDVSSVRQVSVIWKVPEGEAGDFLELGGDELLRHLSDWNQWEKPWPVFRPERGRLQTNQLSFDVRAPPKLVIRHPYLVGSKWNDSIDLAHPRSAITLHVESGPLVTMTPQFPEGVASSFGAFVTLSDPRDPSGAREARHALRRGDQFVMAPPTAGARHVVIDPVVTAPLEIDSVAFDGAPRDLGTIRFARGSSLRIHARATAPFAPPHVFATATRLDGVAYERRSSLPVYKEAPFDPEILGLGAGRFRVTLQGSTGYGRRTWAAEVTLDGVHDAELTILTD